MGNKLTKALLVLFLAAFVGAGWGSQPAMAGEVAKITGFNGSKIKLYKTGTEKKVWKKLPASDLKKQKAGYEIIGFNKKRYAFIFKGEEVWIKRRNAQTNQVASKLPPCPKLASAQTDSVGNAVSRGSGKGC